MKKIKALIYIVIGLFSFTMYAGNVYANIGRINYDDRLVTRSCLYSKATGGSSYKDYLKIEYLQTEIFGEIVGDLYVKQSDNKYDNRTYATMSVPNIDNETSDNMRNILLTQMRGACPDKIGFDNSKNIKIGYTQSTPVKYDLIPSMEVSSYRTKVCRYSYRNGKTGDEARISDVEFEYSTTGFGEYRVTAWAYGTATNYSQEYKTNIDRWYTSPTLVYKYVFKDGHNKSATSELSCPKYFCVKSGSNRANPESASVYETEPTEGSNEICAIETSAEIEIPDENKSEIDKILQDAIDYINQNINNFDYNKCKNTSIDQPYLPCRLLLWSIKEEVDSQYSEIRTRVSEGTIPRDYPKLLEYYNVHSDYLTTYTEIDETITDAVETGEIREKDKEGEDVDGCVGLLGNNTVILLKRFRNLIMIVGPILALVLGTYDLVVAMANGEEEAKKKGMKKMKNRLIAAGLLLIVPYILDLILNIINSVGKSCV